MMRTGAMAGAALALIAAAATCAGDSRQSGGYSIAAIDTSHVPPFSGRSAHALLRRQVEFGPRVSGTAGHAAQLAWMTRHLRERADTVIIQEFEHTHSDGRKLRMANVMGRFNSAARDRVLLLAHWDTRPTADMDRERPREPIPGANDGASGTAVLLEMASVLSRHSPPIGVDILLVDGEDYGPSEPDMYLGAKYFAANQPPNFRPLYGILLDMVGDRNPRFPIEGNSRELAPEVVDRVWSVAEQLGLGAMFPRSGGAHVTDDHIPLNRAGIRTINIIDMDYEHWHTHGDTVENTSPVGLEAVGRVLAALIYNGG
jgi:glutaminyl-peptide cyclotransferase